MSAIMRARIIKIGNSQGVRIPKLWLEQLNLGTEIEMSFESNQIIIRPARHVREGWDQQFEAMATHGDDRLLDHPTPTEWDQDEWEW